MLWLCLTGVQSAAVNVICELARKNPKNYLSLAPLFFKLMTTSTNNWVLIKIIKLVSEKSSGVFISSAISCCLAVHQTHTVSIFLEMLYSWIVHTPLV